MQHSAALPTTPASAISNQFWKVKTPNATPSHMAKISGNTDVKLLKNTTCYISASCVRTFYDFDFRKRRQPKLSAPFA